MTDVMKNADGHTLKIISLNARGLNVPEKRIQPAKADIVFVQETHFRADSTPKLYNHNFPAVHHATNPCSKSKGVSILIAKHCPFQMSESLADP